MMAIWSAASFSLQNLAPYAMFRLRALHHGPRRGCLSPLGMAFPPVSRSGIYFHHDPAIHVRLDEVHYPDQIGDHPGALPEDIGINGT